MDDSISFRFVKTNGITLHIAEQGSGPLVLMLHGFPEFWYSWRHQIPVLAKAGYHVVAPDMRGFGKSDIPDGVEKYTVCHIVGDLVGLLDALHIEQEPGRAETDFARVGYASVLKKIFFCDKNDLWIASPNQEISDVFDEPSVAPTWISLEEINFYADEFQKTGFTGGLNYYRVLNLNWELLAPWANAKVVTPTLFITGSEDVVYALPGAQDYVKNRMKDFVPNLQGIVVLEGAHHFMHEERPDAVNMLILDSLKGFHKCKL
eukprot:c15376_g1_i1 orf=356-1141(+)